jgi:hypothetical protein
VDALSHQVHGNSDPFLQMWSRADGVAILGAIGSHAEGRDNVGAHLRGAAMLIAGQFDRWWPSGTDQSAPSGGGGELTLSPEGAAAPGGVQSGSASV